MGILYIVATPIGNLQDISTRAIDILKKVRFIACEDTRRTGNLLQQLSSLYHISIYDTKPTLISYYEQNELQRIPEIISMLKNNENVALVSDAGTPAISDPGFKLIRECVKEGITVEAIPGPSSVLTSLVISGLPTDKFFFVGYPPRKPGHRKTFLKNILSATGIMKSTVIIFEAPHKLLRTLTECLEVFGDIDIVICREMTKIHEEVRREKISQSIEHFEKIVPKGECVLLFHL